MLILYHFFCMEWDLNSLQNLFWCPISSYYVLLSAISIQKKDHQLRRLKSRISGESLSSIPIWLIYKQYSHHGMVAHLQHGLSQNAKCLQSHFVHGILQFIVWMLYSLVENIDASRIKISIGLLGLPFLCFCHSRKAHCLKSLLQQIFTAKLIR